MTMRQGLRSWKSVFLFGAVVSAIPASQSYCAERPESDESVELQIIEREVVNQAALALSIEEEAQRVAQPGPKRISVLVHFDPNTARVAPAVAAARRQDVRAWAEDVGGFVKYEYDVVLPNVVNLRGIPSGQRQALEAMPDVVFVEDDRTMHAHLAASTPLIRALQSQITGAGLSADGAGIRVCVIDTGIDGDHIMFASRIDTAAGFDFVNNDGNPEDDNGHGTNVAGIAVGGTGLSITRCSVSTPFQGIAPEATLIGIKVLDQNGSGSFSDVIAGINYGADQTGGGGRCDVMNLSLGGGAFGGNCDGDSAAIAANNAVAAGVVFVSSSGNDGNTNAMGTPACASGAIAVGAVYDDDFPNCENSETGFTWCLNSSCTQSCTDTNPPEDSLVCFSNQSDTIDVAAPGCMATSADPAPGGGTISGQCGTSQASPHVAGLAALILSADPSLTPSEVRQIIRDGAIDMGPAGFDRGYGFGRVDAINSLLLVGGGGCSSDPECDDGLFCNGAETCVASSCQSGTAVNCDDGVACTDDSCNEGTNSCDNIANNANCDNGLFCDGAETCNATLGCQGGSAVDCNDGVGCTDDSCNEGTNSCDNVANDANCDDGEACNGAETCDPVFDCQAGVDACLSTVSTFPYTESFTSGFGLWNNVTGDVFDWTRRSGSTPSSNTGPSGDHTTGSSFYVYTETSSPRVSGDIALLEGPCFDLSGAPTATLTFWYSMFGSTMGTLQAQVSTDCETWTTVFSLSGDQGTPWFQANVDLTPFVGSSAVQIRFRGIRGSSWRGDSAVDDISVTVGAAGCITNADCDDGNACTVDTCVSSVCQHSNPGVINGTFDGGGSWTSNTGAGGSITFPSNLNVSGPNGGSGGFTWASQSDVTVNGANLEFDLLSYSSSDISDWDYPVFSLNGTFYGLNSNGTLSGATTGGRGNGGTIDNAGQVGSTIHFAVDIDALAGNGGPHTIGFGVHSVDGAFGAGILVVDDVTDGCVP